MWRAWPGVPLVGLALLSGCQLFVQAVDTDVDGGPPGSDAGQDAGKPRKDSGDTRHDGGSVEKKDAAKDACAAVEDCTNGVDDDCNGLTDCEDPACSGDAGAFSCTSLPAASGWTLVAYDSAGRPACPAHFESTPSKVIVSATASDDTCTCDCNNTAPATCQGQWAWITQGTTCGSAPTGGGNGIANGACQNSAGADPLNPSDSFIGASNGVHTQPGACNGSASVMAVPAATTVDGETCALAKAGKGCGVGAVCAPKVPTAFARCSVMTGSGTCPNGLVQTSVYSGVTDSRGCGACACGTVDLGCNVTGMQFWSNQGCNGGVYDMSTGCTPVAGSSLGDTGGNSLSFIADLSTNGMATACSVTTASGPTGGVAVDDTTKITVCCEP